MKENEIEAWRKGWNLHPQKRFATMYLWKCTVDIGIQGRDMDFYVIARRLEEVERKVDLMWPETGFIKRVESVGSIYEPSENVVATPAAET